MHILQKTKRGIIAGTIALMLAVSAVPVPNAQAASMAELQAQIASLMATINSLQAQLGQSSDTATMCPYAWTRSLSQGSTGDDVKKLQQFLNSSPDTRVAVTGAGSAGMETSYFGPATAGAVSKFQVKYRSEVLAPSGLVNPTGYFGPASIAKANALCAIAPTPTPNPTPTPDPTEDEDKETLSGEGELRTFSISDASDTDVQEGATNETVAELTLEAKSGDIRIDRMEVKLVADSGNTEKDPWDTFKTLSLWVDGDKVASKDIDNRNDYTSRTSGIVRLTGLDLVLPEDEEVEVLVALTVQPNVKGASTAASWNVSIDRLRYFDADRVASDDTSTGDLRDSVAFDIVERGEGEELKFSLATNNPQRTDIVVDSSKRTNNVTILEYAIEAVDGDIELDKLFVNIETDTASFNDVVHDVRLQIGNQSFRKEAVVDTGIYTSTSTRVAFDIDGDITIDKGDKETVRVIVDLKSRSAYQNGETIRAQVTSAERNSTIAEGADDVSNFSGTAVGKTHTLISEGISVPADSLKFVTDTLGQNDTTGTFKIEFKVHAVEGDFYVAEYASTTADTTTGGIRFSVDTTAGEPTSVSAVLSSTGDEDTNGVFTVREGRTETFTLNVNVDASAPGSHRIVLNEINYSSKTNGITDGVSYLTSPTSSFRTPYEFINN